MQVTAEFTNLGPIVDFEVADLDKIGQGHIVACCNMGRHGSLRLVRNGIGLNEQASIELEGTPHPAHLCGPGMARCSGVRTLRGVQACGGSGAFGQAQ